MAEISRQYRDRHIEAILPPGWKLFLVRSSNACLGLEPPEWLKYEDMVDRDRYALEIRAGNNRVMAAVGWYRSQNNRRHHSLRTFGTYVSKNFRRRGAATLLWKAMARYARVKTIYSTPVTDEGFTLVSSLQAKLPNLNVVFEDCDPIMGLKDLRRVA